MGIRFTVIESLLTVSGKQLALLACPSGKIAHGPKLCNEDGLCWSINGNDHPFGKGLDEEQKKLIREGNYLLYLVVPIEHNERMTVGSILSLQY